MGIDKLIENADDAKDKEIILTRDDFLKKLL